MAEDSSTAVIPESIDVDALVQDGMSEWPAPTEEPTPDATADAAETPSEPTDRGDGRDAQGRFVAKATDPESEDTAPAEAATEHEATPTPDPAKAETETPREEAPAQETTPDAPAEPFSVRYGGKDLVVTGSVVTKDGIVIPNDQGELVRTLIGKGLKLDETREQVRRERIEAEQIKATAKAETDALRGELDQLFAIAQIADDNTFAQKGLEYLVELRQSLPLLRERVAFAKERAEFELARKAAEPDPEQRAAELNRAFDVTVQQEMSRLRAHPELKGMTDADWQWIEQRVRSDPGVFLHRVGMQLQPWEQEHGFTPGETVWHGPRFHEVVRQRSQYRNDLNAAAENARKAQAEAARIARENEQRRGVAAPPPPPSAAPAGSAPAKDTTTSRAPSSYEELRKELGLNF